MADQIDDFADYLISQANSDVAAYHKFMVLYDEGDTSIHLFFEGDEDPSFYLPAVRQHSSGRVIRIYNCGGKNNVISVRNDLSVAGYKLEGCLFFVDRDFDGYLNNQELPNEYTYITDGYSIENDIVSDTCLDIVLLDIIGMSHADPAYEQIFSAVSLARKKFAVLMRPMIAWCLASKDGKEKPNFNNVNLSNVFTILPDGNIALKPYGFQKFRKPIKADTTVSKKAMLHWRDEIAGHDAKLWLRGKFELWLFESIMLAALKKVASERKAASQRPPRIPSALRERCLFDLLGGRMPPPQSLMEFIEKRIAA